MKSLGFRNLVHHFALLRTPHACECSCISVMSSVVIDVISSCSQENITMIQQEELVSSILVNNVPMTVIYRSD